MVVLVAQCCWVNRTKQQCQAELLQPLLTFQAGASAFLLRSFFRFSPYPEVACRVEFLSSFTPAPGAGAASVATPLVERFAARLLVLFVRHAALLRPLSQAGKLQLAKVHIRCSDAKHGTREPLHSRKLYLSCA